MAKMVQYLEEPSDERAGLVNMEQHWGELTDKGAGLVNMI
jgi:hypothetical protein